MAVVFYHFGMSDAVGGFQGVDVFFCDLWFFDDWAGSLWS